MISRKLAIIFSFIILVTLISTFTISSVSAKPHFSVKPTIAKNPNLSLTADFKAVDLGKKIATVYLTSLASANLQCVNPGGNSPPAKEVDFERVVNQTVNIKPNDGDIKRSLSLGPPTFPSSSEICSNPNWRVDVLSLIYENVALHIERENSNILTFNFGNVTQR
ncbi:MAG: hypothetical protein WBL64_02360 [Nitrososphaeraceae archaeon]